MNKKLIALAVAGALGAPLVASANPADGVTLFGRVGVEFGSIDIDQAAGANDYRQESISDNAGASRWGLLIVEDLGGGLKANARVEYGFRTGNGNVDSVREQWVGLSHKVWGAVQFGRVHSPFKDFAGGASIDPFVTTNLQARGTGGAMYAPNNGFGAAGFVDHALRYNSPSWGGFSMALLFSPGDATQTDPAATTFTVNPATGVIAATANNASNVGGKGGTSNYQIGLKYKFSTMGEVFGGYSNDEASDGQKAALVNAASNFRTADDETVWRLGTAWNFGNFRIAAQYDKIENALAGNGGATCAAGAAATGNGDLGISTAQCNSAINTNGDGDIWFLSTQYKIGKTTLVLQGGQTKADSISNAAGVVVANEREAKSVALGAIHMLSKRTRVFGGYQRVSVDGAHVVSQAGTTSTSGTAVLATQPDRSTWTLGMRHDF